MHWRRPARAPPVGRGRSVAIDRALGSDKLCFVRSKRRKCTALCLALCSDGSLLTRLALRYYTTYLCACTSTIWPCKEISVATYMYIHVYIAFWKLSRASVLERRPCTSDSFCAKLIRATSMRVVPKCRPMTV